MKILLLHKYGPQSASYRHRLGQFLPALEKEKWNFKIDSLLDDRYLRAKMAGHRIPYLVLLKNALRRAGTILFFASRYDVVFLYMEAFPYLPGVFEWYLRIRKIPYVYDFDDAIFYQYSLHKSPFIRFFLGKKIMKIIAGARTVLGGSPFLVEYAQKLNKDVRLCPTVLDLSRYLETKSHSASPLLRIGWIGSPSTSQYLQVIKGPLKQFCETHRAEVILIGSGPYEMPGVPIKVLPWSEATEVQEILRFDIGLMPLDHSPWSEGKCGFKLIQYLACGVPVVASPVGVNSKIVEEGKNGLLADTSDEWLLALRVLGESPDLRRSYGLAGRKKMENEYSLAVALPIFIDSLKGSR